jgi:hypothetical protein
MRKVNTNEVEEIACSSLKGSFADAGQRHSFDLEISRIAPGATSNVISGPVVRR